MDQKKCVQTYTLSVLWCNRGNGGNRRANIKYIKELFCYTSRPCVV
jgi:hypothetical protein